MRLALSLARRGLGRVEPNPMVGAVLVRDGRVVAQGWHRRFGDAHAEANALQQCRDRGVDPRGCDLYVTLEPCNHHGKTPPCADAIVEAGVARVFIAMADPNRDVAGGGADKLRQADIPVHLGLCEQAARLLNEPYIKRAATGLPWVIAKWAQTLDGYIAARTGHSQWISNDRSRRVVHQLRGRVDAVVVGVGTVLADDPLLTARGVPVRRMARLVVVDPDLRIPPNAKLLRSLGADPRAAPVTVAVSDQLHASQPGKLADLISQGVEAIALPPTQTDPGRLSLQPLLTHLATVHNATNVLVEGGSKLVSSMFEQRLVDQALVFVAPRLLGDHEAVAPLQGLVSQEAGDGYGLTLLQAKKLDHDVMLDYRIDIDKAK